MGKAISIADDARLLCDFQTNQINGREAFVHLYRQYAPMLRATLVRLDNTLTTHDCEDLSHQVFVELWRNRTLFRGECTVGHYLIRIASNLLGKHRRSEIRRKRLEQQRQLVVTIAEDDALLQQREAAELVRYSLNQLPEILRTAVDLVYLQKHSIGQAAELAQCSVHAMESRYRRGKEVLEKHLRSFL